MKGKSFLRDGNYSLFDKPKKKKDSECKISQQPSKLFEDLSFKIYKGDFVKVGGHYLMNGNGYYFDNNQVVFRQDGFDKVSVIDRTSFVVNGFSSEVSEILNIFKKISRPYFPVNLKLQSICDFLETIGFEPIIQQVPNKNSNIVVNSKKQTKKVIVSHYDLIPLFNTSFWNTDGLNFDGDEIQGALDNTITNAIVLYMLKNGLVDDFTTVVFSSEEERGGDGIATFMNLMSYSKDVAYFNLDVTNEFCEDDNIGMSVEYDAYSIGNIVKLSNLCQLNAGIGVTFDRVGDDMCTILHKGGSGASFCLPTKKTIHSFKNKTTGTKIDLFLKTLILLLKSDIDFSEKSEAHCYSLKSFEKISGLSVEEIESQFTQKQLSLPLYDDINYVDDHWISKVNSDVEKNKFETTLSVFEYEIEETIKSFCVSSFKCEKVNSLVNHSKKFVFHQTLNDDDFLISLSEFIEVDKTALTSFLNELKAIRSRMIKKMSNLDFLVDYGFGDIYKTTLQNEIKEFVVGNGKQATLDQFGEDVKQYILGENTSSEIYQSIISNSRWNEDLYWLQSFKRIEALKKSFIKQLKFKTLNNVMKTSQEIADLYTSNPDHAKRLKRSIDGWLIEVMNDDDVLEVLNKVDPSLTKKDLEIFWSRVYSLASNMQ